MQIKADFEDLLKERVAEGVTFDPPDFNDMGIGQVVVSGGVSNVAITIME